MSGYQYSNFELSSIDLFPSFLIDHPELVGCNVTIPYKKSIIQYLDLIDPEAAIVGAVNTIGVDGNTLVGYNSDVYGFETSLRSFLQRDFRKIKALILGTGGAARAIRYVLEKMEIQYLEVSRSPDESQLAYSELDLSIMNEYTLIVNSTPLGTAPDINKCPLIPYDLLTKNHYLFDLVYNPEKTLFLKKGMEKNAKILNGKDMLIHQAEKSWQIWQSYI